MKYHRTILLLTILGFALNSHTTLSAPLKTQIINAANKLAKESSYGWTATVKNNGGGNFRQGPTEGQAEKDGYSHMKMSFGDNAVEMARKGEKVVFKREGEWLRPEDMDERQGRFARMLQRNKLPAQEADSLAAISRDLKQQPDGSFAGVLTELGVKSLYFNFQRDNMKISGVSGLVTFWLKDGQLIRYAYQVKSNISWNEGEREVDINRTTTVVIKDVGKAKVTLPEVVKSKLS